MKATEDQVYIDRVLQGDLTAFAFLVERYKAMAYTLALKIMRHEEEAEDVAQESFVKAYQQLYQFAGKAKFSTWLYTIVYRTAVSKRQKQGVLTFSLTDALHDNYPDDTAPPPLEYLQAAERQTYVQQAIAKLPELEGIVITLFYMNENSIKEIEEITGLTAANIKVKLFRARKILENELRFLL
ncbi:RNA polymerase sigma factor [Rhabdobacter roseus]|uniref:RNA polymerase sigma factor n=1 Tax=Rhabdobacter roseus TaxID=1655419 RepID=A0A840TQL1_9BACT|nr:sigma-70 family RNA polymerase sigma factor [Rhabdobacter roseus]MBB5285614.1 RNA polymerase sigma-70 factor (ECF subfamily) [Rhabdobacter roseus]